MWLTGFPALPIGIAADATPRSAARGGPAELRAVGALREQLGGLRRGGAAGPAAVADSEAGGHLRAQLRVDVGPVGHDPLLHGLADVVAGVADDVVHEVLAVDV